MRLSTVGSLLAFGLLIAAVTPASAHHSFAAEYDENKLTTFTGIVTQIDWQNPHAYISMTSKTDSGETKVFHLELGPPYALVRGGWTKNTVKIGDKVTIEGAAAAKDATDSYGSLPETQLVLESGKKLPTR